MNIADDRSGNGRPSEMKTRVAKKAVEERIERNPLHEEKSCPGNSITKYVNHY